MFELLLNTFAIEKFAAVTLCGGVQLPLTASIHHVITFGIKELLEFALCVPRGQRQFHVTGVYTNRLLDNVTFDNSWLEIEPSLRSSAHSADVCHPPFLAHSLQLGARVVMP